MHISRIRIQNFRNFNSTEFKVDQNAVFVGENKAGKSNLMFALRLVLDPRISDFERHLRLEDFWDGLPRPLTQTAVIKVEVDLVNFDSNANQMAILADFLVESNPMTARLCYQFRPKPTLTYAPRSENDFDFVCFGGHTDTNQFGHELRNQLPLTVLPALRDAESDLANWRRSPLAPLLKTVAGSVDLAELQSVAEEVSSATNQLTELDSVKELSEQILNRFEQMVGKRHALNTSLGFASEAPEKLIRSLRIFFDHGSRTISEASLGCLNLIYLTLLSLHLEEQVLAGSRSHSFLAIEEPEAHLHPHLQRLVFRDFFQEETAAAGPNILMTTHSPHIVSVAPVRSLIILRAHSEGTKVSSTVDADLNETEIADLQRYLDVNRGEIVFASRIILVEGIAEKYLIPKLAEIQGFDLDELGISVCSVEGTNFAPFVKLLATTGLNIPFCVITDMDPQNNGRALGIGRAQTLIEIIEPERLNGEGDEEIVEIAKSMGIFLNTSTLEIELLSTRAVKAMVEALRETTVNGACSDRCTEWEKDYKAIDKEQFLKDIEAVGKGRYAQRLTSKLAAVEDCPIYLQEAIEFVTGI